MRQITEVLRLAAQGLSCRQIGHSVGISRSTVQGYLKRAQAASVSWRYQTTWMRSSSESGCSNARSTSIDLDVQSRIMDHSRSTGWT